MFEILKNTLGSMAEPRGPNGRERGWGLGGDDSQLEGLGSTVSSPSEVLGTATAAKRFSCILEAPGSLSWNLLGAKFGKAMPLPLNQPMCIN